MSLSGLGVQVELGPICVVRDEKGKFTTYTLNFRIAEETHAFTSRYAKLYKFHESLLKNEDFQKSFGYNPPDFPPKSWFTDFTKPKNYKKRANKLLKYFKMLVSRPSVLRNKQFQKGIDLPQHLQRSIKQIAKGLQSKHFIEKNYNKKGIQSLAALQKQKQKQKQKQNEIQNMESQLDANNNSKSKQKQKQKQFKQKHNKSKQKHNKRDEIMNLNIFSVDTMHDYNGNNDTMHNNVHRHISYKGKNDHVSHNNVYNKGLEILLKDLEIKTDAMFIDIEDGFGLIEKDDNYNDDDEDIYTFLNGVYLFGIDDVLPDYLINDIDDNCEKLNIVEFEQCFMNITNENDLRYIDDIALDIRDAIITACEITVD